MESFLIWIFIILIGSALIAWGGLQLIRRAGRIGLADAEMGEENREISIWQWFHHTWFLLKSGRLRVTHPPIPLENGDGELAGNLHPGELELVRADLPAGESSPENLNTNSQLSFEVPVGSRVRVTIDALPNPEGEPVLQVRTDQDNTSTPIKVTVLATGATTPKPVFTLPEPRSLKKSRVMVWLRKIPLGTYLFILAVLVYFLTRIIGLDRFPIYFFTDEAVHTILAEDLVQNHFRFNGVFLPTYFSLGASFGLNSISVYLQVIPYLLFGKSVFVTRAASVLITTLGAIAVGLILKEFFKSRYWWSGVLILSITPVWFLHSRTAFEYVELASFYAIFLYFYLSYRLRSPKALFLAIVAGALVFYTHGLGQFLMAGTTSLLLLVDFPYHWRNRKVVLLGLGLILILAIPYFRFNRVNPGIFEDEMRIRGSYWLDQKLDLIQKMARFGAEYLRGLSPGYWFMPDGGRDLLRHQMKGYGHLSILGLPFFLVGLWLIVKNLRSPAHRTILIALLASPLGAALAQVTILRVIWLVIPAAIIIALGLEALVTWLEKRRVSYAVLAIGLFVVLTTINLYILQDALRNGPTWFKDYGLYGLQYGAKQLFGEAIPDILHKEPNTRIVVTPTWANGTDNFVRFFLTPEQQSQVKLDSIKAYLFEKLPVDDNLLVVLTQPELEEAQASQKFKEIDKQQVIYYPDGSPGFYFVRLKYADNVDEIFAAEKKVRSQPVEGIIKIGDKSVKILYSQIDMGQPESIFDGDTYTLMRGLEANPFVIELEFPEPRPISQIVLDLANMDFTLTAKLYENPDGDAVVYQTTQRGVQGDAHVELPIDHGPAMASKLRLEILSLNGGERPHIHVRELKLNP
jgi:4-amino-4-deoxy-L-arabinose transferase-like glycosyltransferase